MDEGYFYAGPISLWCGILPSEDLATFRRCVAWGGVVTYGLWGGYNNNITLCGTWGGLVATVGYICYNYFVVV